MGPQPFPAKNSRVRIPGLPGLPLPLTLFGFLSSSRAHFPVGPGALRLRPASPLPAPGSTALLAYLSTCLGQGPGWGHKPHTPRVSDLAGSGVWVQMRPMGSLAWGREPWAPSACFSSGRWISTRASSQKRPLSSMWAGPSVVDGGDPCCPGCTPKRIKLSYESAGLANVHVEGESWLRATLPSPFLGHPLEVFRLLVPEYAQT